jgi:choline dehydrogenase-like flavoprotein
MTPGLGADLKRSLRDPGPWMMTVSGFGECLPRYENHVDLDPDEVDEWGIPVLRVHCEWGENEWALKRDAAITGAEMLDAAGCVEVGTFERDSPPGLTIHEMGTVRMGKDPKTSVLNGWNQAHDVPNLFVTDGASMASTACQNPSITYMALTARACDYAVGELKRLNI